MGRIIGWLCFVLLLAIAVWLYFFVQAAGLLLALEPKEAGKCRAVSGGGVVGVEDVTIDPETRLAYLSGYDRRAVDEKRGAIWAYDLSTPGAQPVDLTAGIEPADLLPHGISLYRASDGHRTLFVVSHAGGTHRIEIFDVDGAKLAHRRTVTGPELVSPNDVVGVGADAFYVTNEHAHPTGWMRTVEDYLRLRDTTVQFFDGRKFSTALGGIGGANGINVSADGRSLYLAAMSELTVYVYDRDPQTNRLTKRAAVGVPGYADNIEVLGSGDLLLGLHSKIFDLLAHMKDASKPAPSHIMRLKADGKGSFVPETIYYNPGGEIAAASVGAGIDGRLLVGAIFDPKFLDCTWDGAPPK